MVAVQALMAALIARSRDGGAGQEIEVAMLDTAFQLLWGDGHSGIGDSYFAEADNDKRVVQAPVLTQETFAVYKVRATTTAVATMTTARGAVSVAHHCH